MAKLALVSSCEHVEVEIDTTTTVNLDYFYGLKMKEFGDNDDLEVDVKKVKYLAAKLKYYNSYLIN